MNLLPRSSVRAVAQSMKEGLTADQAVVRAAKLAIPEMLKGLREQALAISASILSWKQPEIRLYPGSQSLGKQVSLDEPLPRVLVLAARRAASDHPSPASLGPLDGLLVPSARPRDGREALPLDPAEAYAYSLVPGPTPVEEVLALLPAGDVKPARILSCLLLLGVLRLEAPSASAGAGQAVTPGAAQSEIDELLERFEASSFYEILSVATDATEQEIKSAYHDLARKYHPDRYQAAGYSPEFRAQVGKLFTYINQAYSTLSDPASREAYGAGSSRRDSQLDAALQARSAIDMEQEKIADSLYRAGRLALSRKEFEKAVAHLKECVWLRPDFAKYHHFLGVAQSEISRYRKDAEAHLQRALELDSTSLESHLELGKLYLKVDLPKRAAAQFEQLLRWDSSHAEAHRLLNGIKQ
jgi:curved DNA-binding protein CbpA